MTLMAGAVATWLVFTVPGTNSYVEGDSVFSCSGGPPTSDVNWVRLIRQDVTGGSPYVFDSLYVEGREDQPESIQVDPGPGAHFYAIAVDDSGNGSCWSEGVYVPGSVSGVGDGQSGDQPVSVLWFGINGWVDKPRASGIYWKVETYARKPRRVQKMVIIR